MCAISPSSALIERSLLNELGGFDERLPACEDYALWLAITAREPVLLVNEPLLEKHGGHADQLSRRYPAMDGFRLDALARLIEGTRLTPSQQVRALTTYQDKYRVYRQGAARRGRHQEIATRDAQHDRLARMLGLLVDDTQWPTY